MKNYIRKALLIFLFVTGAVAGAGLLVMQGLLHQVIHPVLLPEPVDIPEDVNGSRMQITFKDESKMDALYINVPDSSHVVLFCHDGDGHLYDRLPLIRRLAGIGVSVMAIDYRGFGASDPVEITDETLLADIRHAYDGLRRMKWNAAQIVFYGQGLSSGIQGEFLSGKSCAGWIMDHPLPSLREGVTGRIRRFLATDRLSLYPALSVFNNPVMVCFDPALFDASTLEAIKAACSHTDFCETKGSRSRVSITESDWSAWDACMNRFFEILRRYPDPDGVRPARARRPGSPGNLVTENTHDE